MRGSSTIIGKRSVDNGRPSVDAQRPTESVVRRICGEGAAFHRQGAATINAAGESMIAGDCHVVQLQGGVVINGAAAVATAWPISVHYCHVGDGDGEPECTAVADVARVARFPYHEDGIETTAINHGRITSWTCAINRQVTVDEDVFGISARGNVDGRTAAIVYRRLNGGIVPAARCVHGADGPAECRPRSESNPAGACAAL
jgi:hypothetical protein